MKGRPLDPTTVRLSEVLSLRDKQPVKGVYLSDGNRLFKYEGNGWCRGVGYENFTKRPDRFQLDTKPEIIFEVDRNFAGSMILHWLWEKKRGGY